MYVYTYVCIYIHTYIHTYIHAYIHTYILTCTFKYIYLQMQCIPLGLQNRDVVGIAQTGSGKTAGMSSASGLIH